ncbi:hypothetical protein NXS19_005188 [Fusarium pseudograminearum]|uniref:Uncharacterized protein n=1 Tax=Fusarium pseudograminearum (strain CS3096) TaxID=1028729 RepID=K3URX7_FUSPC|nr:hypothetical protein FPSE_04639 [Fusarium pseudograminearum CS3096]EKJ75166.1 hypothetical protein FPSE_04639 [Fusarium pseudograminearum CS3096]KAF0635744.1 hypothetical protein FPSE5266_04639 [Fusarium pseudograminearum]UZP37372.1 hypothetical protein NXS19_005188 [Fusarium pseudograminearum]
MKSDIETPEALWFMPVINYSAIALVQIGVVCVGSMIHDDVKLSSPKLQQCFHSHSAAMCCFAFIMALAELYASIVVASVNGPFIIIPYLFIAQLFVTLLYFYLPFEYYDMEVEEEQRIEDEEKMLSMMDDDDSVIDRYELDELSVTSTPSNVDIKATGYGTMEFSQLSGPGNLYPV